MTKELKHAIAARINATGETHERVIELVEVMLHKMSETVVIQLINQHQIDIEMMIERRTK